MKPGRDDEAGGVDGALRRRAVETADGGDPAVAHGDVGREPRSAGAVHDVPAREEQVERGFGRRREGEQAHGERQADDQLLHAGNSMPTEPLPFTLRSRPPA